MTKLTHADILRLDSANLARGLRAPVRGASEPTTTIQCTNICSLTPGSISRQVC